MLTLDQSREALTKDAVLEGERLDHLDELAQHLGRRTADATLGVENVGGVLVSVALHRGDELEHVALKLLDPERVHAIGTLETILVLLELDGDDQHVVKDDQDAGLLLFERRLGVEHLHHLAVLEDRAMQQTAIQQVGVLFLAHLQRDLDLLDASVIVAMVDC